MFTITKNLSGKCIKPFMLLSLVVLLTACGQSNENNTSSIQTETNHIAYDWQAQDWQYNDEMYDWKTLYVEKYISGLEYQLEQEYTSCFSNYTCWGSNFYALTNYFISSDSYDQNIYYISGYDDTVDEIWHQRIELPELKEYGSAEMLISSFDIQNPKEYVLFVQILMNDEIQAYLAMHFSIEGEFLNAIDLYPAMQSNRISPEGKTGFASFIYIDNEEHYFLTPLSGNEIIVLDADGNLLTKLTWDNENTFSFYAFKTAEGVPLFEQYNSREHKMRLVMYDSATGQEKVFTQQLPSSSPKVISKNSILYYGDKGQLYRWDLCTGNIGVCFNYEDLGLGKNDNMTYIGISSAGFPMILDRSREKAVICKLGPARRRNSHPSGKSG